MDLCHTSTDECRESLSNEMDRLQGLLAVIPPEVLQQALAREGKISPRETPLTYPVLLWVVLAMALFTDKPLKGVYRCCRRFFPNKKVPGRSALCQGRKRLGSSAVKRLFLLLVCALGREDIPGCFYQGYRLMGIDGTRYNLFDSPSNANAFGRPQGGSDSESQGAFPQVGKLSLVEIGTHAELALTLRNMNQSEQKLAPRLLKHVTPEMLLLLDAGFYGYPFLKQVHQTKAAFLARVPKTPHLEPEAVLEDGSFLTTIHPSKGPKTSSNGLVVRVIRYVLDDPQRTGHQAEHRLMTTLLNARKHPALELVMLYHERWEHELVFDEQKTHQDPPRPTKPTHLRSQTPQGVVQEIYALSVMHFVTRTAMRDAAALSGGDPDRLSFTGSFQILQTRVVECPDRSPDSLARWYQNVLVEIALEKIPPRQNRINPRVVRQNRSKWNTKKPEHFKPPPLEKTFKEAVVMLN